MVTVNVRTNTTRRSVTAEINSTPRAVFNELGVDISTSMVNLNGTILSGEDLDRTFEQQNIEDGTTCHLNAIVKADGANF